MNKKADFSKNVITIDESMREIASLDELYNDLVTAKPKDEKELAIKKEEAKFARERILKLSLHVKNLLTKLESHEALK
jgi:hypothetical protein